MLRLSKIIIYNLLKLQMFKSVLSFVSVFGLKVDTLRNNKKIKKADQKHPFLVIITIDTESGYVKKNQERVWIDKNNRAFQGYYYGIKNWLDLARKHNINFSFLLSTQCFSSKGKEYKNIIHILKEIYREGHEIGFHLHPKDDEALQKHIERQLKYTGARYYDTKTIERMLLGGRELIKKHLGTKIANDVISFRWANWALPIKKIGLLRKANFNIDCSSCPGIKGHMDDDRFYDWTNLKECFPSIINEITEFPIATFSFLGKKFRADPVFGPLLQKAFKYYYDDVDRSQKPFHFIITTHSCEASYKNGEPTEVVKNLNMFIEEARKYKNVHFKTLRGCL